MAMEPVMTEAVAPVPAVPASAPCMAWHYGNEQECNREEGNRHYPSHFYLTTSETVDPRQTGVKRRLVSTDFDGGPGRGPLLLASPTVPT